MADARGQPAKTDGTAAPEDPLIGQVLAQRYQIEHKLGEGAMGAVYRAKHVKVGRPFAVKVLHKRLLDDTKVAERFEREAELAGRLRHPNLIGVVDVGEVNGRRYMVMDFAEGLDLAALLNEAPMPAARVINLTRQLCEGLYHAHEQGLIHRDFKPENVIVERDDHGEEVPRIVDFGIAILREAGESAESPGRLTTNGLVLGTPHYMAPEQAVADPIDHRIDLFALGIIVYEMLCGKLPFDGTGAEVARANLLLDPPPISKRVPFLEVDPLLEAFSRLLMAKRRESRPETAKQARELLDLITLDPAAAAEALGVSLEARTPNVTAPLAPQPQAATVTAEVPPQPPSAQMIANLPTPVLGVPPAQPPPPPDTDPMAPIVPRGLDTEMTAPLAWDGSSGDPTTRSPAKRRGPLIATIAAAALLGVGVVVIVGHGKKAPVDDKPVVPPVAMQVTPSDPTPAPVPAPVPVPVPEEPAPVVAQDPTPVPTPTPVHPTLVPQPQHPSGGTTIKLPKAGAPPEVPIPSTEVSAAALATQYSDVGNEISALQKAKGDDATRDLWTRYRQIQLGTAMAQPPAQRAVTSAFLTKIRRDAIAAGARK
jgi:serine/threonine-protein kinase